MSVALLPLLVILVIGALFVWRVISLRRSRADDGDSGVRLRAGRLDGDRLVLPPGEHVIGNARRVGVQVRTPGISFEHARLRVDDAGRVFVQDLSSMGGTFLGDMRLQAGKEYEVSPDGWVRFGDFSTQVGGEAGKAPRQVEVVRGQAGARCPYCHADVAKEDAVACTDCMARHHAACWDEHGQCAACGSVERFATVERTGGRERPSGPDLKA